MKNGDQTTTVATGKRKGGYQPIEIVYSEPGDKAPEHLLARAELRFHGGLLDGLWIPGFALWRAKGVDGEFISVTVPAQEGEDRFYEWLRGDLSYLKRVMVKQYGEWSTRMAAAAEKASA